MAARWADGKAEPRADHWAGSTDDKWAARTAHHSVERKAS